MQRQSCNKKGKHCIVSTKQSDAFLVLARPCPSTPANVLSSVSCVYRRDNRRDQCLRQSNSRRGNNWYVLSFLFFFSTFLLLTLLPDYLLYSEVGLDQRHGERKRFDRGHAGRREIIRVLLVRSGGNGHVFRHSLFSSLLFSLFLFSYYLLFRED